MRSKLFILKPNFTDPVFGSERFYCWHCATMEGVLAYFPDLRHQIDVIHVDFPRPRDVVVSLVGPENQSLPLLVLTDGAPDGLETGTYDGVRFVQGVDAILKALSVCHGIPAPHP